MTPENFCYWLQGFTELQPGMEAPTPAQWKAITEHLQHVFQKVTPKVERTVGPIVASPARDKTPEERHQEAMRKLLDRTVAPHKPVNWPALPNLTQPGLLGPGITITC